MKEGDTVNANKRLAYKPVLWVPQQYSVERRRWEDLPPALPLEKAQRAIAMVRHPARRFRLRKATKHDLSPR